MSIVQLAAAILMLLPTCLLSRDQSIWLKISEKQKGKKKTNNHCIAPYPFYWPLWNEPKEQEGTESIMHKSHLLRKPTINYQGRSTRPGSSSDWLFFSLKGSCQEETKVNSEAEKAAKKLQGEHILIIKSEEWIYFYMYTKSIRIQAYLERAARRFLWSLPEQAKKHHCFRLSNT